VFKFPFSIEQTDPPRPPKEILPTMYDLLSEDPEEPGLPDEFHDLQPQLLSRTLQLQEYSRDNCFTTSDLNLYYDIKHPLWHKRPDWFLVVNVPRLYEGTDLRRSYVLWQEGEPPYVVVEFLSPGTESEDLGRFYEVAGKTEAIGSESNQPNGIKESTSLKPPGKFEVYERHLRVPHYLIYSRYTKQLRYLKLEGGRYQEQSLNSEGALVWLTDLKIGLGIWAGSFADVPGHWLRWCDRQGNWFLTDTEQAQLEKDQAQLEKDQVQAQIRQATQNLLASGMEINQVAEILGLSAVQIEDFCQ
jgi:Uma2 family endonuclease